jgi:hypothetical protein
MSNVKRLCIVGWDLTPPPQRAHSSDMARCVQVCWMEREDVVKGVGAGLPGNRTAMTGISPGAGLKRY